MPPFSSLTKSVYRFFKLARPLVSFSLALVVLVLTLVFITGLHSPAVRSDNHPRNQNAPLFVLTALEPEKGDRGFVRSLAIDPTNGSRFYGIREDTKEVTVNEELRVKNRVPMFLRDPRAMAIDSSRRMYVVDQTDLVIADSSGRHLTKFSIPDNVVSVAVLNDDSIAISHSDDSSLITLFDQSGNITRKLGAVEQLDKRDKAQNRFLNQGKVAVSRDDVYYISMFSPTPVVKKFSREGQLLTQFEIRGPAADLQSRRASEFLLERPANTVGGFFAIRSATVDAATGNLWIAMNGSSRRNAVIPESGVLYEYNENGQKLAEYALVVIAASGSTRTITDVKDIAVQTPYVHVITSQGQVYSFNTNMRSAETQKYGPGKRKENAGNPGGLNRDRPALLNFVNAADEGGPCPEAQEYTCFSNCPQGSSPPAVDCAAVLKASLTTGEIIINGTCSFGSTVNPPNGGCTGSMTGCRPTGVQVTYSTTLNCNAAPTPTPTPEPTPEPSPTPTPTEHGGPFFCWSDFECHFVGCWECICFEGLCSYATPILIDVSGNGFDLTSASAGVNFDLNNDGATRRVAWTSTGSDDAFLALDRNGNGRIDSGNELFGDVTPQPVPPSGVRKNGFLALAEYDKTANGGNGDGRINRQDAIFSSLRLWHDANHNGISEPSELHRLRELGLAVIDLDYKESRRRDQHGNWFRYRAEVRDTRGAQVGRWAWDVLLVSAP